jgi:hypothetical protein
LAVANLKETAKNQRKKILSGKDRYIGITICM